MRRDRKAYTTISVRKMNRKIAEEMLTTHREEWEMVGITSRSDLYEEVS